MKYNREIFNTGDLIYWYDFWHSECGIGLFLNYINNFNVKDIYIKNTNSLDYDNRWINVLVDEKENLYQRMFPPTSVYLQSKFKTLEEFKIHVENFRPQKNKRR